MKEGDSEEQKGREKRNRKRSRICCGGGLEKEGKRNEELDLN